MARHATTATTVAPHDPGPRPRRDGPPEPKAGLGRAAVLFHRLFWRAKERDRGFSLSVLAAETGLTRTTVDKLMNRSKRDYFAEPLVRALLGPLVARGATREEVVALMGGPGNLRALPVLHYETVVEVARSGGFKVAAEGNGGPGVLETFEALGGIADWQLVADAPACTVAIVMWDWSFAHAMPGQRLVVDYGDRDMASGGYYVVAFGKTLQVGRYAVTPRGGVLEPVSHEGRGCPADFVAPLAGSGCVTVGRVVRVVSRDLTKG